MKKCVVLLGIVSLVVVHRGLYGMTDDYLENIQTLEGLKKKKESLNTALNDDLGRINKGILGEVLEIKVCGYSTIKLSTLLKDQSTQTTLQDDVQKSKKRLGRSIFRFLLYGGLSLSNMLIKEQHPLKKALGYQRSRYPMGIISFMTLWSGIQMVDEAVRYYLFGQVLKKEEDTKNLDTKIEEIKKDLPKAENGGYSLDNYE